MNTFRPTGFKILPPVVKNLLIINGLFYLATMAAKIRFHVDLADILGLHYILADKFEPYQFITYMFMHSSTHFSHILFNMFALWMFGNAIENIWGPKRFLIYYLITGVGAAITHYVVFYFQISPVLSAINTYLDHPSTVALNTFINSGHLQISSLAMQDSFTIFRDNYNQLINTDPGKALQLSIDFMSQYRIDFLNAPVVIGASGAVFGILLAFGMMFPNSMVYVFFAIPMKTKYFVMLYGAIELFSGIYETNSNVAHFAHLGGMLFGFIMIKYWARKPGNMGL